jgi:hypothetical protein
MAQVQQVDADAKSVYANSSPELTLVLPDSLRRPEPIIFSIRGSKEWRDWLGRFAAHQRVNPTALIDQVLTEAARRSGFPSPPPRHRGTGDARADGS